MWMDVDGYGWMNVPTHIMLHIYLSIHVAFYTIDDSFWYTTFGMYVRHNHQSTNTPSFIHFFIHVTLRGKGYVEEGGIDMLSMSINHQSNWSLLLKLTPTFEKTLVIACVRVCVRVSVCE